MKRGLFSLIALATFAGFFLGRDARGPSARVSADGWYYHVYLVSLFTDGDLDFTDEYKQTGNWYHFGSTATGLPANPFGIGPAIYEIPFYLGGQGVARLAGEDAGGFGARQAQITMLAAPAYSLLALVFLLRFVRRRFGDGWPATLAAVAVWAAGPVLYYAMRQPGYAHPFATCFTTWFLDAWDRAALKQRTLGTWIGLGALLGATALARPQLVLWGVVLVPLAVADLRRPHHLLAGAAAALAVFAPQLVAWNILYGAPLVVPQGPGFMVWGAPRWSEVLFAARNGLFAWAPLWGVAIVALAVAARGLPRLAIPLLVGFALQVWANAAVWDWWGGGSFGGRRFDSCLVPVGVGLAWLVTRRRVVAAAAGAVAAITVVANVWIAQRLNVFTLPANQGEPLVAAMGRLAPGPGHAAGALSWLLTLPARAAFAVAHGAPLAAYDRVVGVHRLTDQYPGTGGAVKNEERLRITGNEPWVVRRGAGQTRLLIALNRRHGAVAVSLRASGPVELRWDGHPVTDGQLTPLERGVHDLDVSAAPGTVLQELQLSVDPRAAP